MKPTLRQIPLPGRVRLEFAEQGERTGTPVIVLHGATDSWRSFEPMLPRLPPDLRVTARLGTQRCVLLGRRRRGDGLNLEN